MVIVIGGVIAAYKLDAFRDFEPHLTITHEMTHRLIGDNYVHIAVTAALYNSSKVVVEVVEAFFRLKQVSPILNEEAENLYAQVFIDREEDHLQWTTLDEVTLSGNNYAIIVEPGQSHAETYEFIISNRCSVDYRIHILP